MARAYISFDVGQIFAVHGLKKIKRKEGSGTRGWRLLGVLELVLGILLIFGHWHKFAALILGLIMLGVILLKVFSWKNQRYVSNIEYDFLILFSCLVIYALGPGYLSIASI